LAGSSLLCVTARYHKNCAMNGKIGQAFRARLFHLLLMEATGHSKPLILLVDDDENDTFLLKKAFERAGLNHPVKILSDGMECIRYLGGEGSYADREMFPLPGIVLLDLRLPVTNGFDVLKWIREQPLFGKLCVVVLSGSQQEGDENLALRLGATAVMIKPMGFGNAVELSRSIERLIAKFQPVGEGETVEA
jgi:CheY-like chemotaxis protein